MNILANDGISESGKNKLEEYGFNVDLTTVAQDQLINYINENSISTLLVRSATQVRKDIIERLTPKVDWKKVLRYFVKTSTRAHKSSTVKRVNRRYAYIHPGRKVNRQAQLVVAIDQSGSVSDGMLAAFYGELNKLASLATFTVIPFDTRVAEDKVYVWRKGQSRKVERVLHGGTCFDAPTKYVNDRAFDGHIVLTDMCAPKPISSKCQRMWMTTEQYANSRYFETKERVVVVD